MTSKPVKEQFDELWQWLSANTKNFVPRPDSYEKLLTTLVMKIFLYEYEYFSKETIAVKTALDISQNHFLINGNKRVAFGLFMILSGQRWQDWQLTLKALEME